MSQDAFTSEDTRVEEAPPGFNYPGPHLFSKIQSSPPLTFAPEHPELNDYVEMQNPTNHVLRFEIALGADVALHANAERHGRELLGARFVPLRESELRERLQKTGCARADWCRMRFTFQPGERQWVPKIFAKAIQHRVDGNVVSGLCPQLCNVSETESPPLAPGLQNPDAPNQPQSRRRTPAKGSP